MVEQIKNQNTPVVLFDIDWTLLNGINNTHRESFKHVFKNCFDLKSADVFDINPHGLTDTEIIFKVAEKNCVSNSVIEEKMIEAQHVMSRFYSEHAGEENPILLPGVKHLLNCLRDNEFNIGILSGNLSDIGKLKLGSANILGYFDIYCFPDTTGNKTESISVLRNQGLQNEIVIVGDTPNEIISSQATNSRSIAVATGSYSYEDLSSLKPDVVVETLEDSSVLDFLLNL